MSPVSAIHSQLIYDALKNGGFLASVNGIVSCAQLYRIPLLMLISHRGAFGERDPWQPVALLLCRDLMWED